MTDTERRIADLRARLEGAMVATMPEHDAVPKSVRRLWHEAQISHRDIPGPDSLLAAILDGGGGDDRARIALGLAVQEVSEAELVDLMIDKVLTGAQLHHLLVGLNRTGHIRRDDLVEWSEMFA